MANKNTKAAPRKAADEPTPEQTTASAEIVPEQELTGKAPDGSDAPDPMPAVPTRADTESASAAEKAAAAPAKSTPRNTGKAPAKAAKTIRDSVAQSVAKQVFKSHPDKQTVYVTSDGTPFFVKCDADNHGRTLDDKLVVAVTNENYKA